VLVIFFLEDSGPFSFGVSKMGSSSKPIVNKDLDNKTTAAIDQTQQKTPYQKYLDAQFAKWSAFDNQTGPKDITQAPGMSDYLDIYGNADQAAAQDRIGDPSHAFTANLPGFNNQLQSQRKMGMYDTRAEGLHNAYEQSRAQGLGEGATAADLDINRRNA
jgi:hypothetical protein